MSGLRAHAFLPVCPAGCIAPLPFASQRYVICAIRTFIENALRYTGLARVTGTYCALNLVAVSGVSAAVIVQRHHLFVWSVMAPKFLYAAVETILMSIVCGIWLVPAAF